MLCSDRTFLIARCEHFPNCFGHSQCVIVHIHFIETGILVSFFLVIITFSVFGSLCQPLGKGILQRLLLNLCAHSVTRTILIYLLLDMIKPEAEGSVRRAVALNSQRLYGCHSNTVYGRSQLWDGNCLRLLLNIIFMFISIIVYCMVISLFVSHCRSSSPSVPPSS